MSVRGSYHEIDLVLSGHTHGGQFRFPFIGGLGNSVVPLRFNNRPELILVELVGVD